MRVKNLFFLTLLFLTTSVFSQFSDGIEAGSSWKYLDDGSNLSSSWVTANFDDASWSEGNAQLGYGDGDESTVISYGSNSSSKHITYYFRKTFDAFNMDNKPKFKVEILRDDGAVVYLNGTELFRTNMPTGNIDYQTLAAHTVSGDDENKYFPYEFDSDLLETGENIIAVEVHQRKASSSDLSFDLKLSFTDGGGGGGGTGSGDYRKAPYLLYPAANNKMMVVWQLTSTQACTLSYGTDNTYSTGQINSQEISSSSHIHKKMIDNLAVNTKYFYKVDCNSAVKEGTFYSGKDNSATKISFYAYGDTRSNPGDHDKVAQRIMNDISQDPGSQTFILASGDLVSHGDQESDWDEQFFSPQYTNIQKMLANLPYLATMGNHEGQGVLFEKYFPYPMYQGNHLYYSFDNGPVHISVIDQYENYSSGSTQLNWLKNDLSSSTKPWKIILLHEPGWSAGGHSNNSNVQNLIQPLCEDYGVQFVVAGHNHYYSRALVNDVHHITTGGGGAPLYSCNSGASNIQTCKKVNHYCKFVINDSKLTFSAITSSGSIIETFDIFGNDIIVENNSNSNILYNVKENTLKVSIDGKIIDNIEVYNISGQKIYSGKINASSASIKLENKGMYIVKTSINNQTFIKKIVK